MLKNDPKIQGLIRQRNYSQIKDLICDLLESLPAKEQLIVLKDAIPKLRPSYIEELLDYLDDQVDLQEDLGYLLGEEEDIAQTRLIFKYVPYRSKKSGSTFYPYIYIQKRTDKIQKCVGTLFQTNPWHDYKYILLDSGGIVFENATFKLSNADRVKYVRLVRIDPPDDGTDIDSGKFKLSLQFQYLHPETLNPQSNQIVDFPDCFSTIFNKKEWSVEYFECNRESKVSPVIRSDKAKAATTKVAPKRKDIDGITVSRDSSSSKKIEVQIQKFGSLSRISKRQKNAWYVTDDSRACRLIGSEGEVILEFRKNEYFLFSPLEADEFANVFEELALLLSEDKQYSEYGRKLFLDLKHRVLGGASTVDLIQYLFSL